MENRLAKGLNLEGDANIRGGMGDDAQCLIRKFLAAGQLLRQNALRRGDFAIQQVCYPGACPIENFGVKVIRVAMADKNICLFIFAHLLPAEKALFQPALAFPGNFQHQIPKCTPPSSSANPLLSRYLIFIKPS